MNCLTGVCARIGLIVAAFAAPGRADETSWQAGWSSTVVTPESSMWMAGFGNRTEPSDGTLHDLRIRVLALQDADGHRGVLVAGDLLGIPKSIYDNVCERLFDECGLHRSQVMLNSSHTHNSPVLRGALLDVYPLDDAELQKIEDYSTWLETKIVETVGEALERMEPVELYRGEGDCGFSTDRQWDQEDALVHNVPVLAVRSLDGELKVVVMTYACHPTSLKNSGWLYGEYATLLQKWSPDFPQFAVARVESNHPGAMAMFTQGCGGDRSAPQEGRLEKTEEIGALLGLAVEEVLSGSMRKIEPRLRTSLRLIELPFGDAPTTDYLTEQLQQTGGNTFLARWADRLLEQRKTGRRLATSYPEFPVQVWRLGENEFWVSLGGETVSGYSIAIREQIAPGATVFGYTNDVMAYIPTPEIIQQGQYIGHSSMAVYGLPTMRWQEGIQEQILGTVRELVDDVSE